MNKLEVPILNVFVTFLFTSNTCVISGLNAAKREIGTLKTSVNKLGREKREHIQSKQVELSMV